MKNKKIILLLFMLPLLLSAQPTAKKKGIDKKERIESMKIAFITDKVELTPYEAKIFWPVYNAYEKEQKALRNERREIEKKMKEKWKEEPSSMEKLSEKELDDHMLKQFDIKNKENELSRKYHSEFKKVLTPYKVLLFYRSQKDFRKEVLRMIKKKEHHKKQTVH